MSRRIPLSSRLLAAALGGVILASPGARASPSPAELTVDSAAETRNRIISAANVLKKAPDDSLEPATELAQWYNQWTNYFSNWSNWSNWNNWGNYWMNRW